LYFQIDLPLAKFEKCVLQLKNNCLTKDKMNPLETLTRIRSLGAKRASKCYDKNKDAINFKRRAAYALKKENSAPTPAENPVAKPAAKPVAIAAKTAKAYGWDDLIGPTEKKTAPKPVGKRVYWGWDKGVESEDEEDEGRPRKATQEKAVTVKLAKVQKARGRPKKPERKVIELTRTAEGFIQSPLTQEKLVQGIYNLKLKDTSTVAYLSGVYRVMKSLGTSDLAKALKSPEKVMEQFRAARQSDGEPYSENTIKQNFQVICKLIDYLPLDIDKTKYERYYKIQRVISDEQAKHRRATEKVPTYKTYLKKSLDKFGVNSKEYLLARLYEELTVRDDFGLEITTGKMNLKKNYLLIKPESMYIIINQYKTDEKYGQIKHKLSLDMHDLVLQYIERKQLKAGMQLFKPVQQSAFLCKTNKSLGYSKGSNLFRKMMVSQEMSKVTGLSAAERVTLSERMFHSPVVQLDYLRELE